MESDRCLRQPSFHVGARGRWCRHTGVDYATELLERGHEELALGGEVSKHGSAAHPSRFRHLVDSGVEAVGRKRDRGALDDVGAGHGAAFFCQCRPTVDRIIAVGALRRDRPLNLRRFPIDALKIDRSFVTGVSENVKDATIVAAVVALAHAFGIPGVAEGVETIAQADQLADLGCDLAQGYLWGEPQPADRVKTWSSREH